jgi:hypothetical protein
MKKLLYCVMAMGILAVIGCGPNKPEDAAKAFMNQQISAHQGFDLDTSGLTYEIVEETPGTSKVLVSGDIAVEAELSLVKTGGKWVVAGNEPEVGEPEKAAETNHTDAH